jgi:TPR repeat protein
MFFVGKGVEQNYTKAFEWYLKAAEQGNTDAQIHIGYMYHEGKGVDQNDIEAIKWLAKAAEQGDANAQYNLGVMFGNGYGTEQDEDKALDWYEKAAKNGYRNAYWGLASTLHYLNRHEEALPWAEKSVSYDPNNPDTIGTFASILKDLGRNQEALEKFELCLKLLKEQEGPEKRIKETEVKIAALKELMKNGKVSKQ